MKVFSGICDIKHVALIADGQLESWEGATPINIQKPRYVFRIYLGVRSGRKMFEINTFNTDDITGKRLRISYDFVQ